MNSPRDPVIPTRAAWRRGPVLLALCAASCSLQSLDYLGGGQPAEDTGGHAGATGADGPGGKAEEPGSGGKAETAGTSGAASAGRAGGAVGEGGQGGSHPAGGSEAAPEAGSGGADDTQGVAGAAGAAGETGNPDNPVMVYGIDGQSCAGAALDCAGSVSCCTHLQVPAGTYQMGTNSDANAVADEKPPHAANIAAFELDEFEVTLGRFRRFAAAYDGTLPKTGSGAAPQAASSGWQTGYAAQMPASQAALTTQLSCDVGGYQTWTAGAGVRESMPVNCVSWYVAFAFCIWDGGRLPTEAEWEKASAGGDAERLYPWGTSAPDAATNVVANCLADGVSGCTPADLLAVGSRSAGAGRWGHNDLAGSLWEWTLDYYDATYYQSIGTCNDCVSTGGTTPRVIRGGNFTSKSVRATMRASKPPNAVDPYAGFRCAR